MFTNITDMLLVFRIPNSSFLCVKLSELVQKIKAGDEYPAYYDGSYDTRYKTIGTYFHSLTLGGL